MSILPAGDLSRLADAHRRVTDRIAAAALRVKRDPKEITLVAVTKSATIEQIAGLVSMGQRDLGENRVQQLTTRAAELTAISHQQLAIPHWHMIGHLQRNKVKQVAPIVSLIHSVDSVRLAEELSAWAMKRHEDDPVAPPLDILFQVNIAGEAQKYGLSVVDASTLAPQIAAMPRLRLRGLMTMAPYSDVPETSRPVFAAAATLYDQIRTALGEGTFNLLSMGMSDDFEVAIEEGANVLRVGRALFE